MTLRDEILALDPALLATRDDAAIAAAASAGRTRLVKTEIGNGLILETIGLASGNTLLDFLASQEDFRHVRPLLEQGRLDVSSTLVRGALDGFAQGGVITQAEADALKALAEQPDPITEYDVRCAMYDPATGEWRAD